MKNVLYLSVIAVGLIMLAGCASMFEPTMFDVPQSQWNALTPEQKQEVIKGYNERKNTEAQMAPIKSAVKAADHYLQQKNLNDTFHSMGERKPF